MPIRPHEEVVLVVRDTNEVHARADKSASLVEGVSNLKIKKDLKEKIVNIGENLDNVAIIF